MPICHHSSQVNGEKRTDVYVIFNEILDQLHRRGRLEAKANRVLLCRQLMDMVLELNGTDDLQKFQAILTWICRPRNKRTIGRRLLCLAKLAGRDRRSTRQLSKAVGVSRQAVQNQGKSLRREFGISRRTWLQIQQWMMTSQPKRRR